VNNLQLTFYSLAGKSKVYLKTEVSCDKEVCFSLLCVDMIKEIVKIMVKSFPWYFLLDFFL
jgi:hypothetical protein